MVGGDEAALEEGGAQTEPWGDAEPGARGGGAGQDAQEPPRETEAGERGARGLPRALRPCPTLRLPLRMGSREGARQRGRRRPGQGASGPGSVPRVRAGAFGTRGAVGSSLSPKAPHLARRRSVGGAGGDWGCGAASTKPAPPPRGRRGGGEGGAPPGPARDPAPGGLEAALGAGALCLDSSGAPRASAAVPAPLAPAPLVSGSPGSRSPAGAGMGRGLRAPPLPDLSDGPGEPHRGRALGDCPGLRVSRLSAPLSRRAFPWRAPGRPSLRETKEAGGGGPPSLPGPRIAHRPPVPCAPPGSSLRSSKPGPSPGPQHPGRTALDAPGCAGGGRALVVNSREVHLGSACSLQVFPLFHTHTQPCGVGPADRHLTGGEAEASGNLNLCPRSPGPAENWTRPPKSIPQLSVQLRSGVRAARMANPVCAAIGLYSHSAVHTPTWSWPWPFLF